MLLQWGTESNESMSSECCASLIIFYLTSPSCSLTKKNKVHAQRLQTTGEGVQSNANGNISNNEFFECYVPTDGPNTTTTPRAQCIWGMLLMFLRIILTLCRWDCRAIPILSCPPSNLIFSSKCHSDSHHHWCWPTGQEDCALPASKWWQRTRICARAIVTDPEPPYSPSKQGSALWNLTIFWVFIWCYCRSFWLFSNSLWFRRQGEWSSCILTVNPYLDD